MGSTRPLTARLGAALAVVVVAVAGCGGGAPRTVGGVVASTDVWGSVAHSIAGDDPAVRSIIGGPATDPHSYDPSASDAAEISDAALVVYNGGDYDPWVGRILAEHPDVPAVDAFSLLDAAALGEPKPANEHVFYELNTAAAVADRVADRLAETHPDHAGEYRSRASDFRRRAEEILRSERAIGVAHPGVSVVATEPVAHYLLRAAGVTDKTPPGFANAVAADTDPSPADVAAILDLIGRREVSALLYNDQTVTEVTKRVRAAAQDAGIPVVEVTETLPAGKDYLSWQADTAAALAKAVEAKP